MRASRTWFALSDLCVSELNIEIMNERRQYACGSQFHYWQPFEVLGLSHSAASPGIHASAT